MHGKNDVGPSPGTTKQELKTYILTNLIKLIFALFVIVKSRLYKYTTYVGKLLNKHRFSPLEIELQRRSR